MKTTRRALIGAAGVTLLAGRLSVSAQTASKPAPSPVRSDAGAPPDRALPSEGLSRLARDRFGKFMDEGQLKLLDERLAETEARGGKLRSFKLTNADEPAVDFRAVRS